MTLKEMRIKKGMTQQQLATKAELSITMVSLIEQEKTSPSIRTLQKLANALDCDIKQLL